VPETVAPNVITLVAFAIIVVSHIVFMFWGEGGNNFTEVLPPWKYALFAVSLFLYQHLDNMDGKQARRTSKCALNKKTLQQWECFLTTGAMLSPAC
jgi:ethanolaminephosphotransferase